MFNFSRCQQVTDFVDKKLTLCSEYSKFLEKPPDTLRRIRLEEDISLVCYRAALRKTLINPEALYCKFTEALREESESTDMRTPSILTKINVTHRFVVQRDSEIL